MNKRVLMVVGMALVLFVSVLLVAPSAMAQGPGEGFQPGRGGQRGEGMGPRMGGKDGAPHAPPHLETIAEALGMTTEDLMSELQDGQSVAEVAEAQGVDLDTVVDAVLAEIEERLDTLVENGRLTQEEADERLENARERVTERMNQTRTPAGMGPGSGMADGSGAGSFQRPGRGMFRP